MHELGDTTEYGTYTFHDVVSSFPFEQGRVSRASGEETVPLQPFRQQILDCYHLRERCSEEIRLLKIEMKNVVEFYVNDIKILQNFEADLCSLGDIAVINQETERQKIRLRIHVSNFQQFVNIQDVVTDEVLPSYITTNDSKDYDSGSDTDSVGDNDSDDENG